MRSPVRDRRADGVDDRQRSDPKPACGDRARRAHAALQIDRGGAVASAGAAQIEGFARGLRRHEAELAIGRMAAPILVAAVEEIEADRGRHDRHPHGPDGEAAPLLPRPGLHPRRRVEPERRAAREDDGVRRLHHGVRREEIRLPRPRRPAHHGNRGHGRRIEDEHGDARCDAGVVGMAHAKAGDVGDEVLGAR